MKANILYIIIFAIFSGLAESGESHTVTQSTVPLTLEYNGSIIPQNSQPLILEFSHLPDAKIKSIAEHGSKVSKGQVLLAFDSAKLDDQLVKTRAKLKKVTLEAAQAKSAVTHLKKALPLKLEAGLLKRTAAEEDLAYFEKALEPLQRKKAEKARTDMEKALKYTQAEYEQLKKMYAEDQVTEETEEIILERQKDRLRHRKFAVEEVNIKAQQELNYLIPRELQKLKAAQASASLAYEKLKIDLPAEIEQLKVELELLNITKNSVTSVLDKLEEDKRRMTITASHDGVLYYGSFSETGWNTKVLPMLKPGKTLMDGTLWGTLITSTSVQAQVKVKEADVPLLTVGAKGLGLVESLPGDAFETELTDVSEVPVSPGEFLATFSISVPEGRLLWPGQTASLVMTAKVLDGVCIIPSGFIHQDKEKHLQPYVWLKGVDGVVKQPVTTGINTSKGTQITKGLAPGNIILKTNATKEAAP